ncbi:MAG TPA: tRNA lysidine(34) synthetase TilS [Pyrinomonadaceae bacterium]|nr:tRNA lysidine(34) synthetase TilS [Pyrinomonadaceae bacterium]
MERARLSRFARRVLSEWERRGWPVGGERVVVAVSGGADSTALLLCLDELLKAGRLKLRLTVAHLDHGLRGERGAEDALWVEGLARALGHEFVTGRAALGETEGAAARRDNLEQAARRARYEFLARVAREARARAVLAAHTLDDQAETVLLRLLRGSGAEGLGGIRPERVLEVEGQVLLLRPLVAWARRAETEAFCRARGVEPRADEMNADERFARVRVRRTLLPLLETFNPRVAETLARTAELLSEDARALELEAARLLEAAREMGEAAAREEASGDAWPVRVEVLAAAPKALRRRALRQWLARGRGDLRRLGAVHVAAVEKLLAGEKGGRVVELPGGARIERRRGRLFFGGEKD